MSTRVNISISEGLKHIAEEKAHNLGLSLSAYIRLLLSKDTEELRKNTIDNYVSAIEKEGFSKPVSKDDFLNSLDDL
ncbi:CopG family transcriptional regulator [Francisella tularensis]|uniref:CopG family transcriptional regulator n=1 Tax=Francisella tularensis TaxID=263 RepID=UPI0001855341|nr:CopG family transcriptional regulator [Francisella tularensis]EDZ90104.1 ribbon-helix-helix protein, CopG family [Francisella tularensis subsp. novicida FTG]MBK2335034.1 CopG family transcriptional regulator [Francisella tularensis subsp. novicida]